MKIIDAEDLIESLFDRGVEVQAFTFDERYALPTRDWFFGPFAEALGKFLQYLGTSGYEPQVNDCDDFARAAAMFAQVLNKRTQGHPGAALAVGEFGYRTAWGKHAVIVAMTELGLFWMEPQTQKQIVLTNPEIESCLYVRF